MSELPGCWHLFNHKGTFPGDSLVNDLTGHVTFGSAHTLAHNSLYSMDRTLTPSVVASMIYSSVLSFEILVDISLVFLYLTRVKA